MASDERTKKSNKREDSENQLVSLYDEYYDKVAHYAYTRIGDKDGAEDIASEVFLKALESLKKYEERGIPLQAWLFKIAHNLVVDYYRKAAKYKTVPIEEMDIQDKDDPEYNTEIKIEMERVTKVMEQLSKDQLEVIKLRFFGGLTAKEIGDVLDKSQGAVREMQHAALDKLRQLLYTGQT